MQGAFSKEQSIQVQGIAILLMIWHHFFLNPFQYGLSFFLLPIHTFVFSWFARITIGLYSFVSGYGMYVLLSRTEHRYRASLSRAFLLYGKHWFGLTLLVLLPKALLHEPLVARTVLLDLTAIRPELNGSMWYVFQYLVHMLIAPLLWMLFAGAQRARRRTLVICGAVVLCGVSAAFLFPDTRPLFRGLMESIRPTMLAVFPAGFLCARYDVFARLQTKLPRTRLYRGIVFAVICVAATAVRMFIPYGTGNSRFDVLIVPVFVFGVSGLLRSAPPRLQRILTWFGNHSTWLWITHIPVFGRTQAFFMPLGNALLFYLAELALIIPVALLLSAVWNALARVLKRE